jgi:hypothetical protein
MDKYFENFLHFHFSSQVDFDACQGGNVTKVRLTPGGDFDDSLAAKSNPVGGVFLAEFGLLLVSFIITKQYHLFPKRKSVKSTII